MERRLIHFAMILVGAFAFAALVSSCHKDPIPETPAPSHGDRRVVLMYSAAHNNLSDDLLEDIDQIIKFSDLEPAGDAYDALLIFIHSGYRVNRTPYLLYPHLDDSGQKVVDTLVTYPSSTVSASSQTLNEVMTYVKNNFPADSYGLLFSSHATGYLPEGYYTNSDSYEKAWSGGMMMAPARFGAIRPSSAVSYPFYEDDPLVKSIGQDYRSNNEAYEIGLADFCAAIPMELDFIVFDACLMSGIEVAYELRDKTRWLVASPTEIISDGMDYTTMYEHLFSREDNALTDLCRAYYNYYNQLEGSYRSATIALTDCSALEPLADVCSTLFEKYRTELDSLNPSDIQRYYRMSYHWFYDLGDIVEHLGCTEAELTEFNAALDDAVVYKAHTPYFIQTIEFNAYSGLSMLLPSNSGDYLKNFYTGLEWNKATGLIVQ